MIIPIPEMKIDGGLSGGLSGGLNPELTELYQAVKDNPGKKGKELAVILSRPIDTVDKQISKLIDKKLVERRGSRKTGGYYILSP
jgi:ATP-dependent DNA helicase RecG